MSQIKVEVNCDSISSAGVRLTTFVLIYPRLIHSELMTHRVFSRNASSSRAIPVAKQIQECIDNPVIPTVFYKNQKGMQGTEPYEDQEYAKVLWLKGRDRAVETAKEMLELNLHKQHINRVLEPYAFISVVLTSTDFDNFFALRYHEDADPTILELAKSMYTAYVSSTPNELKDGLWHLPFIEDADTFLDVISLDMALIKMSVARCARVSYKTHDGKETSIEKDFALYDRLINHSPIHASPAEHQAMAVGDSNVRSGNFRGWIQFRQTLKNQNVNEFKGPKE